jgi:hypothetical protein
LPPDDDRPKWSITWLFRVQRIGRNRAGQPDAPMRGGHWFSWSVLLLLLVEIAVLVWLGIIPR